MYAGTTLRDNSGNVLGAHQKIDRLARGSLKRLLPHSTTFPTIKEILAFEGNNGPDGVKRKSAGKDEPWHFYDPDDPSIGDLIMYIEDHLFNLSRALREANRERASFEAAWLAHAIVDGMTPAHHYPLHDKIEELWGKPMNERMSVREKNFIKGINRRDTIAKNWEYWGAKGVFTTHAMFELGVATTIAPMRSYVPHPTDAEIAHVSIEGFIHYFKHVAREVAAMKMYDNFGQSGWTAKLARQTRARLLPLIANAVALAWLSAVEDSVKS